MLAVIQNELSYAGYVQSAEIIRGTCSVLALLLCYMLYRRYSNLNVLVHEQGWRAQDESAWTLLLELLVCILHPCPLISNTTSSVLVALSYLRVYLVGRVIVAHSKLQRPSAQFVQLLLGQQYSLSLAIKLFIAPQPIWTVLSFWMSAYCMFAYLFAMCERDGDDIDNL